ncbi:MAG: hypothetical protein LBM26_03805 [Methanobrevibacter sp.]|jgi:hypothetical protein|nr:hypothetical protein [Methanobrevibacter sp.]
MSEEYVKKIRHSKIVIILGILILIVSNIFLLLNYTFTEDGFWIRVLNYVGAFLFVFGLVRWYMIKRNPALVESNETTELDKRKSIIRGQAAYLTLVISTIVLALMNVIFIYLDYLIPLYLSLGLMFGQCIIYIVLIWHYGKKL